jgi:hypothetical protein
MTKEQFKGLFLKLTEYTIPFKKESLLEKYLPSGFKRDKVGNYFYQIGSSETLFTTHLDTYSRNYEKVNHVIDESDPFVIRTDGTTILGGDNKLGCSILIGMIQNNIPGTYFFFLGEEPIISGGVWGSTLALKSDPDFFKSFKRCIAFDRRGFGSVVIRQMGRMSSSEDFVNSVAGELTKFGKIVHDKDGKYGYYTDTAVFMDVIPECSNISAGGFNEHHKDEWVDLNYTYSVYQTALQIDWESLPVKRKIGEERFNVDKNKQPIYNKFVIDKLSKPLSKFGFTKTRNFIKDNVQKVTFSMWMDDFEIDFYLKSKGIYLDPDMTTRYTLKQVLDMFKKEEK